MQGTGIATGAVLRADGGLAEGVISRGNVAGGGLAVALAAGIPLAQSRRIRPLALHRPTAGMSLTSK